MAQWCEDATERQKKIEYKMLYVKQEEWEKYKPTSFGQLARSICKLVKDDSYLYNVKRRSEMNDHIQ